jgi:hypothetical protein
MYMMVSTFAVPMKKSPGEVFVVSALSMATPAATETDSDKVAEDSNDTC